MPKHTQTPEASWWQLFHFYARIGAVWASVIIAVLCACAEIGTMLEGGSVLQVMTYAWAAAVLAVNASAANDAAREIARELQWIP